MELKHDHSKGVISGYVVLIVLYGIETKKAVNFQNWRID